MRNIITVDSTTILIIFLTAIIILHNDGLEMMDSGEAIQGVASVYNTSKMTITDLNVTGKLNVAGDATVGGKLQLGNDIDMVTGKNINWNATTGNSKIVTNPDGTIHISSQRKYIKLYKFP